MPSPELRPSPRTGTEPLTTDEWAARLRGFGPAGLLAMAVIPFVGTPLIGAILVVLWAWLTRTPWRDIGYVPPRSWTRDIAVGILFGGAFKFVMKALVMPLFRTDPINQAYHYVAGNAAAAAWLAVFVSLSGGFGEETVYRGFLFERFSKLFGSWGGAKVLTVLLTSMWFAAMHYPDQGVAGTEQAVVTGIVFGTIYAVTGSIFLPMVAHAAFDLAAIAFIYWDLEARVAQLVFK